MAIEGHVANLQFVLHNIGDKKPNMGRVKRLAIKDGTSSCGDYKEMFALTSFWFLNIL